LLVRIVGSVIRVLRWLSRWRYSVAVGAVMLALIAFGATLAFSPRPGSGGHAATLPTAGRTSATLEIVSGTPVLTVEVARLGGTLLRAWTPSGDRVKPVLTGSSPVRLSLVSAGGGGKAGPVSVQLNSAIAWNLDFAGGTQRTVANLRGGRVSGMTFAAGSDVIDVTMPRPSGTVIIRVAAGASQLLLTLPPGVPARVTAGGGSSQVTMDSLSHTGVAGGTVITAPGWATAGARFDIDATSGVARVAISRW
jgi:hypothetical protein